MTLAQQRQRMFAVIALLVLVSLVIIGFISFEVSLHMNFLWQAIHSVAAVPKIWNSH